MSMQPKKPHLSYTVQHVDTDASGVVHFSRYASLSETAALDHLNELQAGLTNFQALGFDLRVRRSDIKYLAPARFRDHLSLNAELKHVGAAHFRSLVYVTLQNQEAPQLIAQAELDFAVVDKEKESPACIPDELRTLLCGSETAS